MSNPTTLSLTPLNDIIEQLLVDNIKELSKEDNNLLYNEELNLLISDTRKCAINFLYKKPDLTNFIREMDSIINAISLKDEVKNKIKELLVDMAEPLLKKIESILDQEEKDRANVKEILEDVDIANMEIPNILAIIEEKWESVKQPNVPEILTCNVNVDNTKIFLDAKMHLIITAITDSLSSDNKYELINELIRAVAEQKLITTLYYLGKLSQELDGTHKHSCMKANQALVSLIFSEKGKENDQFAKLFFCTDGYMTESLKKTLMNEIQ